MWSDIKWWENSAVSDGDHDQDLRNAYYERYVRRGHEDFQSDNSKVQDDQGLVNYCFMNSFKQVCIFGLSYMSFSYRQRMFMIPALSRGGLSYFLAKLAAKNLNSNIKIHFLVVSHDSIRGCVCPWVRGSVGNAFDGGQRRAGERLILCTRTCLDANCFFKW